MFEPLDNLFFLTFEVKLFYLVSRTLFVQDVVVIVFWDVLAFLNFE